MILNIIRTVAQLRGYLDKIQYPVPRILLYALASIATGIWVSSSPEANNLPILTVTAILFGFTINAVVMLGNSSNHYLSDSEKYSKELKGYYKKSLFISIHTLGIGLLTILFSGIFMLFPEVDLFLFNIEIVGATVYSLVIYYLIMFSIVIAAVAELVLIRIVNQSSSIE